MADSFTGREPVTRREHDEPWAANLESDAHADNRQLLIEEAIDAIEQTRAGQFVDLVTHESHGHPSTYLYDSMRTLRTVEEIADEGRCSCGGYVTRVTVRPQR